MELDPITGVMSVTEKDYVRMRTGQIGTLITDAYPGETFEGRIDRIAPVFREATRQARVELVITSYSIHYTKLYETKVVTPDIKRPGESRLLLIDLGNGRNRLGGSALAQVYGQIGDRSPDVNDPKLLKRVFRAVQGLIARGKILAGHDRSDGGLITALLEMAFSGNCGLEVSVESEAPLPCLFSEELGSYNFV